MKPVIDLTGKRMTPIPNSPGYSIDENSEVFSYWRRTIGRKSILGDIPKKLKPCKTYGGYLLVNIHREGKKSPVGVHRLVLETFVGPCPKGMEACHNNGIRADNRPTNLRWDTRKNNHADKKLHGTQQCGERSGNAKLTNAQVIEIRRRRKSGEQQKTIACDFGVTEPNISMISRHITWSHLK
jgi:hypothetical protein